MTEKELHLPKQLTIIGNGFDLTLGAKTSYECFYNCLKTAFESVDINSFKEKYGKENNTPPVVDFYNLVKSKNDNYFVNYFLHYEKIFGNWVSFEVELTKIISSFDSLVSHLNSRNDYIIYNYHSLYLRILTETKLMSVIHILPDNKFFKSGIRSAHLPNDGSAVTFNIYGYEYNSEYDIYKSIEDFTERFPKELYKDLIDFSKMFSLFLLIVKDEKNDSITFGEMLDSDYFINYNYTNYLSSIISKNGCTPMELIYINGKIDYFSKEIDDRIVFGIDSNTKLNNIGFEVFTKTVQRSLYNTDVRRLSYMLRDNIERIYIYGHSINLADFESLNYVFSRCEKDGKPEIIIYCYDQLSKIDTIMNLKRILGNDKFNEYQREGRLSFLNSNEAVVKKKGDFRMKKTVLVTGGAGFIGNCFCKLLLKERPEWKVVNVDSLTYAANPNTIKEELNNPNYKFYKVDIRNREEINKIFEVEKPNIVVNFAAESHVDRSILDPESFLTTNIIGTEVLMDACRKYGIGRYHQVSTDEVYGDLPLDRPDLFFHEDTPLHTSSPYSTSKASADLLVLAYYRTYGLPVTISRCSNNYGPYQFPEKLIPLMIYKASHDQKLPVYGQGINVRDWLYVEDHCRGILAVLERGRVGEVYNLGGHNERNNIYIVKRILSELGKPESLIEFVADRHGHDQRYAIDPAKANKELGWDPITTFEVGIKKTIEWYLSDKGSTWLDECMKQNQEWLKKNYDNRN